MLLIVTPGVVFFVYALQKGQEHTAHKLVDRVCNTVMLLRGV